MLIGVIRGGQVPKMKIRGGLFAVMRNQGRSMSMCVFRGGQVPKMRIQVRSGTKNEDSGEVVLLLCEIRRGR